MFLSKPQWHHHHHQSSFISCALHFWVTPAGILKARWRNGHGPRERAGNHHLNVLLQEVKGKVPPGSVQVVVRRCSQGLQEQHITCLLQSQTLRFYLMFYLCLTHWMNSTQMCYLVVGHGVVPVEETGSDVIRHHNVHSVVLMCSQDTEHAHCA